MKEVEGESLYVFGGFLGFFELCGFNMGCDAVRKVWCV